MKKTVTGVLAALLSFSAAAAATAATLTVTPSETEIAVGDIVDVSIVISDLGEGVAPSLSAYDLDLTFNDGILDFTGAVFGSGLDVLDLGGNIQSADAFIEGTVTVSELSFDLPADLEDFQPQTFTLVTLMFAATETGSSALDIVSAALVDALGKDLAVTSLRNASLTIIDSAPIPLPGAALFFVSGLAALVARRR